MGGAGKLRQKQGHELAKTHLHPGDTQTRLPVGCPPGQPAQADGRTWLLGELDSRIRRVASGRPCKDWRMRTHNDHLLERRSSWENAAGGQHFPVSSTIGGTGRRKPARVAGRAWYLMYIFK